MTLRKYRQYTKINSNFIPKIIFGWQSVLQQSPIDPISFMHRQIDSAGALVPGDSLHNKKKTIARSLE